jgi:hypothetical protein
MDKTQANAAIDDYLEKNKDQLQDWTVDPIVHNVQVFLPAAAAQLTPGELSSKVINWQIRSSRYRVPPAAASASLSPNPSSVPPSAILPASPEGKLREAVKKAITTVVNGVDIKYERPGKLSGKINIGVGGPTAELKKGDAKLSAGVSWGGTLSVQTDKGDFHFQGELSSTRWQIQLTYPEDAMVPDLTTLGKVFGEGEKAMRNIIGATASFKTLSDVGAIKDAISPQIQPVKDAVDAVQGIAKAPPKKPSVGISLGSPDPLPNQTTIPRGVQVKGTVTVRF